MSWKRLLAIVTPVFLVYFCLFSGVFWCFAYFALLTKSFRWVRNKALQGQVEAVRVEQMDLSLHPSSHHSQK